MNGALPPGLLALVFSMMPSSVHAEADDPDGNAQCEQQISSLNNDQGYGPCEVVRQLLQPCFPRLNSSDGFDASAWLSAYANSTCSCNNVVYNLLSACEMCRSNHPMPFSNWTSKCSPHNVSVTSYYPIGNVSVHVPMWASVDLASDGEDSKGSTEGAGWGPLQIAVPIISALGVLLACVVFLWWYRSKHRNPGMKHSYTSINGGFMRRFRRPSPVIHERLESWVVDMEPEEHPSRLSSYSTDSSVGGIDHKPSKTAFSAVAGIRDKIFMSKGPVPLNSLPRRQGFRIDDTDLSTKAASRSSTMIIGAPTARSHEDERSILLISRNPGVDFTIESTTVQSPRTERAEYSPRTHRADQDHSGDVGLDVLPASPIHSETGPLPNPHSGPVTPEYLSPSPSPAPPYTTYINLPPMNRGDPSNLIPVPVRAAGYDPFRASTSSVGSHSRNASAESLYWYGNPATPPGNLSPGSPGSPGATASHSG